MFYNIALLASNTTPYCKAANELFSDISDGYILSKNSHPHITLCQFISEEPKSVKAIWEQIKLFSFTNLLPKFIGINFQKGKEKHEGFYWSQIVVEREPTLMDMHQKVLNLLNKNQIKCITDNGDLYKPHVTLARIKLKRSLFIWGDNILDPTAFRITLGMSDENGQYLKVLYE